MSETAFDPASRRLCPDGACIGLIGPDGRCKECGRAASGRAAALVESVPAERVPVERAASPDAAIGMAGADAGDGAEAGDGQSFDPSRRLCDDGSCVGVVGPDGVCRACGRRAE